VRAQYGDDEHNFYAADTFNEMDPGTNDPAYLRNASSAVYNARAPPPGRRSRGFAQKGQGQRGCVLYTRNLKSLLGDGTMACLPLRWPRPGRPLAAAARSAHARPAPPASVRGGLLSHLARPPLPPPGWTGVRAPAGCAWSWCSRAPAGRAAGPRPAQQARELWQLHLSGPGAQAMAAGDAGARWIMQAWLFYNEKAFWGAPQIKARPTLPYTMPGHGLHGPRQCTRSA
jgi:hypothetical protein